jgi:phosphopantothenoylcysteine decarboxylase/phosphopantothenate--cysteine ligase
MTERVALPMAGQRLLLGVSGGIAAYKAAELVRRLREQGAEVRVVMTEAAQQFVGATTFQALSGHPVRTTLWDAAAEAAMGHIELARWATRVLIAPASADVLARLAAGLAGDLLGTLCLATEAPLAVAPAMNRQMWAHPATRANLATLQARGVHVLGPGSGEQACGEVGEGRMWEPSQIVAALLASSAATDLAGWHLVVSAGPTYEDLDPVRFLGNRSSGRMGFAIAGAAARRGARVVLVAGPVKLPTPPGVQRVDVRSAAQMQAAVMAALGDDSVYIGTAAVADYTPAAVAPGKIKKAGEALDIRLVRTPDILAGVAARQPRPRAVVGFAAETDDVIAYARGKLQAKGLDWIAANRVGESGTGFDAEENALTLIGRTATHELPRAPKTVLAEQLLDHLKAALEGSP